MALEGEASASSLSFFDDPDPDFEKLGSKFTEPGMGFLEQEETSFLHWKSTKKETFFKEIRLRGKTE